MRRAGMMKEISIKCVDAFTNRSFSGNPAGIIGDADPLSQDLMQQIAGNMFLNIIEYGYVTRPRAKDASFRIRYFTPKRELACSGHVTVAACYSLIEDGRIELGDGVTPVTFETGIGNVRLDVYTDGGRLDRIMMNQPVQGCRESDIPVGEIADVLGIERAEISLSGIPVAIATADVDYLLIPVRSRETILGLHPDLIKLGIFNKRYNIFTNHIFTTDTFSDECISYARHFGPAMGLWEDPATALAAGGLGEYLVKYGISGTGSMMMEQGSEIDRLARLYVEVDRKGDAVTSVRVGGLAATSISRKIRIEDGSAVIV
jgi:PhzF family phenazine biosynthesis protein